MHKTLYDIYLKDFSRKIFLEKNTIKNHEYFIMYINDITNEKENYRDAFGYYLPNLVSNNDLLDSITTSKDLMGSLKKTSSKIWKSSKIIPHRNIKISGIYGELFLDFYSRIIENNKMFLTYASKRAYRSNYESYGYDEVLYSVNGSQIQIILSEAKFLSTLSNVKSELKNDMLLHMTKEYFNNYMDYVVEKGDYERCSDEEKITFKEFINDINTAAQDEDFNMINYLKMKHIKFKFVFFAIYQHKERNINNYSDTYIELNELALLQLKEMGIEADIDIVFIPTHHSSMDIKTAIGGFYD